MIRKLARLIRRQRHWTFDSSGRAPQDPPDLHAESTRVDVPADFIDAAEQVFGDREKRTNRRDSW